MSNKAPKPELYYDQDADVLYVVAKEGAEEEFVEIAEGVNVELDKNKEVIGIEILNASSFMKPVLKIFQGKAVS